MPLIIDPDFLNQGTEAVFDTAAKTIQLIADAPAGNLTSDGVTSADYVFQVAGQVDDAAAGKVIFPLTAEHADQVGEFYFDIEVTDTAGYIDTPVKGRMIFNQDITK